MGCCSIRIPKYSNIITSASTTKALKDQRDALLAKIFFLHNLILNCNNRIETFIIEEKKHSAFLLKSKKLFIKEKSKSLQKLISKVDECLEDSQMYKIERNEINKEMLRIEEELKNSPVFDKDVDIDDKPSEYIESLQEAVRIGEPEKRVILSEIEQEVSDYKKKKDELGGVIRKKHNKNKKICLISLNQH